MGDERRYSGKEINKIIHSILNESRKKKLIGGGYTRSDINATAADLGISQARVDQAISAHENKKTRLNKYFKKYGKFLIIGTALLVVLGFLFWPKPFSGRIKITFTSHVSEGFSPVDDLQSFSLFFHDKIYCFLTFYDISEEYKVKCIFLNGRQEEVNKSELTLKDVGNPHLAYFTCDLLLSSPPGAWKAKIFVDDVFQLEKEFIVEPGNFSVTFSQGLDANNEPINSLSSFSRSKHSKVVCYLNWSKIKGEHLMEWKWINPSGVLDNTSSTTLKAEGGGYWAYHSMNTKNKATGTWKVEFVMDSIKFGEKSFTLTE